MRGGSVFEERRLDDDGNNIRSAHKSVTVFHPSIREFSKLLFNERNSGRRFVLQTITPFTFVRTRVIVMKNSVYVAPPPPTPALGHASNDERTPFTTPPLEDFV